MLSRLKGALCLLAVFFIILSSPLPASERKEYQRFLRACYQLISTGKEKEALLDMERERGVEGNVWKASLLLLEGLLLQRKSESPESRIEEALRIFRNENDKWGEAYALLQLGNYHKEKKAFEKAAKLFRESIPLFEEEMDYELVGICHQQILMIECALGNDDPVERASKSAADNFVKAHKSLRASAIHSQSSYYYFQKGSYEKSLSHAEEAAHLLEGSNEEEALAECYIQVSNILDAMGRGEEALLYIDRTGSLKIALPSQSRAQYKKGVILLAMSRMDDAMSELRNALKGFEEAGLELEKGDTLYNMGMIYHNTGFIESAIEAIESAGRCYASMQNLSGEISARRYLGDIYIETGDMEKGLKEYEEAVGMSRKSGDKENLGKLLAYLGGQMHLGGNFRESETYLLQSLEVLRESDSGASRIDEIFALNTLGSLYIDNGESKKAAACIDRAIGLCREASYPEGMYDSLHLLSSLYSSAGDLAKSSEILRNALSLAEERGDRAHQALFHTSLGFLSEKPGLPEEAMLHYEKSLRLNEECGFKKGSANAYLNIGFIAWYYNDDYTRAEENYGKALDIYREIKDCRGMINALQFLGGLYKNRGDREKGLNCFDDALKIAKGGRYAQEEAEIGYMIGYYTLLLGNIDKGMAEMEKTLPFYREHNMKKELGDTLISLSQIYLLNLGNNEKADAYCSEARKIYTELGNRRGLYECSMAEARINEDQERYEEALRQFNALMKKGREDQIPELEARCLVEISRIYELDMNDIRRASEYLEKATKTYEKSGLKDLSAHYSLEKVRLLISDPENKKESLAEAAKVLRDLQEKATKQNNAGFRGEIDYLSGIIQFENENYEKALHYFQEGLRKSKSDSNLSVKINKALLSTHCRLKNETEIKRAIIALYESIPHVSNIRQRREILDYIRLYYVSKEDHREVVRIAKEMIELDERFGNESNRFIDTFCAGQIAEKLGDKNAALDYYLKATEIGEGILGEFRVEEMRIQFLEALGKNMPADIKSPQGRAIDLLLQKGEKERAFAYSERDRARAFVKTIGNKVWPSIPQEKVHARMAGCIEDMKAYAGLLGVLRNDAKEDSSGGYPAMDSGTLPGAFRSGTGEEIPGLCEKKGLTFYGKGDHTEDFINNLPREYMDQYKQKYEEAIALLKLENPDYYSIKSISSASLSEIQSLIDNNSALIEYYVESDHLFIFLITSKVIEAYARQVSPRDLKKKVVGLRKAISDGSSSSKIESMGSALYEILIEPLEKQILSKKRLIIVPHKSLHYLPFAAICDNKGAPLVEKYSLVYAPSATALTLCRRKSQAHKTGGKESLLVGFALGNAPAAGFSPLPETISETNNIGKLFPRNKIFNEAEFTKERLTAVSHEAQYLHLATHGILDGSVPRFSGIATRDGIFYVDDIMNSPNLDSCTLVTISACQTALGKLTPGDELVGISRAFIYAGAPSVVASLWSVSDESTSKLMTYFYGNLAAGMEKDVALQSAQKELMKQYPGAFHWAPFILIGDWKTFEQEGQSPLNENLSGRKKK